MTDRYVWRIKFNDGTYYNNNYPSTGTDRTNAWTFHSPRTAYAEMKSELSHSPFQPRLVRSKVKSKSLSLNAYAEQAMRTAGDHPIEYGGMGCGGEGGEVCDLIKKHVFHGHPLDKARLVEELGDNLWYIAFIAHRIGVTLEEVAKANVRKTESRYPDGFSPERSINRDA